MNRYEPILVAVPVIICIILLVSFKANPAQIDTFAPRVQLPFHMQVKVISIMDEELSRKRREDFEARISDKKLSYHFFPGIDGRNLRKEDLVHKNILSSKAELSPGQMGCLMSHVALWESSFDNTLILEDDAVLTPAFWTDFDTMVSKLPLEFDALFLGHVAENQGQLYEGNIHHSVYPRGTHGYLVSSSGLDKLRSWIHSEPKLTMPIDEEIAGLIAAGRLKAFSVFPALIEADNAPSVIGSL